MYGSILFNCWAALLAFTVYFVLSLQNKFAAPMAVIGGSLAAAAVVFVFVFVVRKLLHYIFFSPEEIVITFEELQEKSLEQRLVDELPPLEQSSSIEFPDENSEDIARVVRTMMHNDDHVLQS